MRYHCQIVDKFVKINQTSEYSNPRLLTFVSHFQTSHTCVSQNVCTFAGDARQWDDSVEYVSSKGNRISMALYNKIYA